MTANTEARTYLIHMNHVSMCDFFINQLT